MSDILSSYFSTSLPYKNNISYRNNYSNEKHSLKLLNNEMMLKLPKITPIPILMTEHNISSNKELIQNRNEEDKKTYYKKKHNYNNKTLETNIKLSNTFFRNKVLSELNHLNKSNFNKYTNNPNYSLSLNPVIIKSNLKALKKENNFNNNKSENQSTGRYQSTESNNIQKDNKNYIINEYISRLINDNNNKKKNRFYSIYDKEKKEKYSINKSIDPTKYIKNKFLDDSFNNNEFKISKIQNQFFNGNDIMNDNNIKNINENNKNNLDLLPLQTESYENKTRSLINKMFDRQYKIKNFYFGKKYYSPNYSKIKNNTINIKTYLRNRRKETDKNNIDKLTIDERMKNVLIETKKMKNTFVNKHKIREKIITKIKKHVDNNENIIMATCTLNEN